MNRLTFTEISAIFVLLTVHLAISEVNQDVHNLTNDNICSLSKGKSLFVLAYTPNCIKYNELTLMWNKLPNDFKEQGYVQFAKIDCSIYEKLCRKIDATIQPTVLWLSNGQTEIINGARSAKIQQISSIVTNKIQNLRDFPPEYSEKENPLCQTEEMQNDERHSDNYGAEEFEQEDFDDYYDSNTEEETPKPEIFDEIITSPPPATTQNSYSDYETENSQEISSSTVKVPSTSAIGNYDDYEIEDTQQLEEKQNSSGEVDESENNSNSERPQANNFMGNFIGDFLQNMLFSTGPTQSSESSEEQLKEDSSEEQQKGDSSEESIERTTAEIIYPRRGEDNVEIEEITTEHTQHDFELDELSSDATEENFNLMTYSDGSSVENTHKCSLLVLLTFSFISKFVIFY